MRDLVMPPRSGGVVHEILKDVTSVVIVGANGSGKSRLGAWLETQFTEMAIIARQKNPQNDGQPSSIFVHRISAQRGLTIEENVQSKTLEQAQRLTLYGSEHPSHGEATRFETKWQSSPTGHLLNNFQHVLAWAFAENGNAAIEFREQFRQDPKRLITPGESKLETAGRIWRAVMPQRDRKSVV